MKNRFFMGWRGALLFSVLLTACGITQAPSSDDSALHSERGGIGVSPHFTTGSQGQALTTVDPRKSLAITETQILNDATVDPAGPLPQFTLPAVLGQLAAQSGTGQSGNDLFRQMWDTYNSASGSLFPIAGAPHCSDNGSTNNGFPITCRNGEGAQAGAAPAVNINTYHAVGLFNRFDLAPADGSNCGEYRIIFGKNGNVGTGRNLIIFEATLPNPQPSLGLEGCRAVASFWADLSTNATPFGTVGSRAFALRKFYFQGLSGFSPVVHVNNYGNNAAGVGQVRVDNFIEPPWSLREFKLKPQVCSTPPCKFLFFPVTDKVNPFPDLFNPASSQPLASAFQSEFLTQVSSLAVADINLFNYQMQDKYNTAFSVSQADNYLNNFGSGGTFGSNIQNKLNAISSPLTPAQIVARANALSCAGCHETSGGADIGPLDPTTGQSQRWPLKNMPFTHVDESATETGADGVRFLISNVLTGTFLPHRQTVLQSFLDTPANAAQFVAQSVPTQVSAGASFTVSITFKNTGTASWTEVNAFRLGSQNPQDNTTFGTNRAKLAAGEVVAQGQNKTFTFTLTAPTAPGTYPFQWRMVKDPGTWFGDFTPTLNINVIGSTDSAQFVSQSVPTSVTAGSSFLVYVTMTNDGNTTWTETSAYRLGSQSPQDNTTWSLNRVKLATGEGIAPGQSKTFAFYATAPAVAGTYAFQWRMVHDGVAWFGAFTPTVNITVVSSTGGGGTDPCCPGGGGGAVMSAGRTGQDGVETLVSGPIDCVNVVCPM